MAGAQAPTVALGSEIVTPVSTALPVFMATRVYVNTAPTVEYDVTVVVLVIDNEPLTETIGLTSTLAEAWAAIGELADPAVAVTTLRIGPEAAGAACTTSVTVTDPPAGRSAVSNGEPVPVARPHTPPALPRHVHDRAMRPAGTGSEITTPSSRAGPALLTTMSYENVSPGVTDEALAVFCTESAAEKSTLMVAEALLFVGSGSTVLGPTVAVAMFTIGLAAETVAAVVIVKVADPPAARSIVVLTSPVPLAGQDEPGDAEQTHVVLPRPAGMVSRTVTPLAGSGPLSVTTTV